MTQLTCASCGANFTSRADARYCSDTCRQAAHRKKWTAEETIVFTDYLVSHDGELREGSPELVTLRDRFFGGRKIGSVFMHGLDIRAALGYDDGRYSAETKFSAQIRHVAGLFKADPKGMAYLARDIRLLWQIRGGGENPGSNSAA